MIQPERVRFRSQDWTPKPLNAGTSPYDVALRKTPNIGGIYFQNKFGETTFYKLIHTGQYKLFGKSNKGTILYWERQDGKLFVSGVFQHQLEILSDHDVIGEDDMDMHQAIAVEIGLTQKRIKPVKDHVGKFQRVTILHKNVRSNAVLAKNVPMSIWHVNDKMKTAYWKDRHNNTYWAKVGSTEVRPFTRKINPDEWLKTHNQINCSG